MGGKFKQNKHTEGKGKSVSRKDFRKQLRKEKKAKKNDYFKNKKKVALMKNTIENSNKGKVKENDPKLKKIIAPKESVAQRNKTTTTAKPQTNLLDEQNKLHKQEMREKAKLERGMVKSRKKMLLEANREEDKGIKRLEKQLKLNKRKSKTIPKSFVDEGLGYLLEVCDSEKLQEAANTEINLQDSGSEFEDDFALITGKGKRKAKHRKEQDHKKKKMDNNVLKEDGDSENYEESGSFDSEFEIDSNPESGEDLTEDDNDSGEDQDENEGLGEDEGEKEENEEESDERGSENNNIDDNSISEESETKEDNSSKHKNKKDGVWEDIYGRLRDKKGNVVKAPEKGKYVPPHLRAQLLGEDSKRTEELARLKKQLKGLVNRLAESNMHSIANQIDELYMRHSRNDMNDSLLSLVSEALVSQVLTPERLVMEHTLLITVLHANVGMEVGAHFLESFVQRFDAMFVEGQDVENKELDNLLLIISHLYNFKVSHAVLLYNILDQLTEKFTEKEVELILLVLRSVGFSLRKDDPLALKNLVLRLQKKASESTHLRDNPRLKFMLDVLLAVKNNNMTKIPQYDPSLSEHLKKLLKTLVHKGKYVTELKVTLEDLLKAEERGRWWIVGSAWSGAPSTLLAPSKASQDSTQPQAHFSEAVLELARKQRMNTDTRRNIFCILVTAEDYLDAFEKLLRLGLKGQQEQEIVHIMVHCLLSEKKYNPFYAHLATHFCQADRKHQISIQYHVWDKVKELSNMSQFQITNLAKFLAHLFLEKALPISVLKVLQFSEMDKSCVRLLRQVLLSILLSDSVESLTAVFTRVARSDKLRMFRESMRLFLHHFVLRNVSDLEQTQAELLRDRVKLAETALTSVDTNNLKYL